MLLFFATLLVGAQAATKAQIRDRRCVICDYVVHSLQNRLSDDILAGKKVKVGWRLNSEGKRVARSVAYGVSETGFMEYLEDICAIETIRWSFEYGKEGRVKLQDDGLRSTRDKLFEHTLGHDDPKARSYAAACDWFLDKYEQQLHDVVRKWPRQIVQTQTIADGPSADIKDVYMGNHGGTSTIVYYMCALQAKDLCKKERWPATQLVHLANQVIEYQQQREQEKELERQKREYKKQQKKKKKSPSPSPKAGAEASENTDKADGDAEPRKAVEIDGDGVKLDDAAVVNEAADNQEHKTEL